MSEDQPNGQTGEAAGGGEQKVVQPKMNILAQYIRDLSFENALMRNPTSGEVSPQVQVGVALDAKGRGENRYEVICKYEVKSTDTAQDRPIYLLEMEYCGIFQIENVPQAQLHPFLMIECPRMLFPFARRIVGDITRDGGFPQLNIDNIDFVDIYRQRMVQKQQENAAKSADA